MSTDYFRITSGEDRTLALTAKDRAQAVFPLTGATVTVKIIHKASNRLFAEKTGTVTDEDAGAYTASLTSDDTTRMSGLYRYEAFATISGAAELVGAGRIAVSGGSVSEYLDYGQ